MEIYVENQQIHITKGDVSLNWTNIRFDSSVADEWSTEIELPNDKWNINLLDAYGLLDRGALFNHKIKCLVMVDSVARDGYLQILTIEEHSIKARVFLLMFPYEVLDKKVCEYYPKNDIVYRWDRYSHINTTIAGEVAGIFPYDYSEKDFYSNIFAQWHASCSVSHIIDLIQSAENITLPTVSNTLWELAARKKVCPSNPYQVMMGSFKHSNAITDRNLEMAGGQHITNDLLSDWKYSNFKWLPDWSNWNYLETAMDWCENAKKMDVITFNRSCTAHIKVYACATKIGGILIPRKNGVNLAPAAASAVPSFTTGTWSESDVLIFDDWVDFDDGDELTFHYSGSAQVGGRFLQYSVVIEYEHYDWDENDYDVDLEYIPAPFCIFYNWTSGGVTTYDDKHDFAGNGDGTHSLEDYSFTYFGVYSNLEREMTVREYISDLCWIANQKLYLDKNELIFMSPNVARSITANMKMIEPATDKLGQNNKIGYRDAEEQLEFAIDNEFLDDEMELHISHFYTNEYIPQYSYEMTYSEKPNNSGDKWVTDVKVNFEDLSPVIMSATYNGSVYTMEKAPDLQGLGLSHLTNATQITFATFDTVWDCDYVYVDGHKYMVISGEEDMQTGENEITVIKMDSMMEVTPPTPPQYTYKATYQYPSSTYDTVFFDVAVSYGAANFTLCGVQLCTNPDFTGQIISASAYNYKYSGIISDLEENTIYYYRYFAESTEFGYATYTPNNNSFKTNYASPVLTISHDNVTDTTASVSFTYVGNYPINTQAMSGVISTAGQSPITVQFDHLAVGVPEVVNLSGLTPNTVYDVSWDVEYYNDEASAIDSFTTSQRVADVTLTNVNGVWGTQTAQLTFTCDWQSTNPIAGYSSNFRIFVSKNSDFSGATEQNSGWSRQLDGMSGSINATLTANIPSGGGNNYYVKIQFTDTLGNLIVKTFTYVTPTQNAGYMTFKASHSDPDSDNTVWFPTNIHTWTYAPYRKRILLTLDNWQTIAAQSAWTNYPNSNQIFITLDPNTYIAELEVIDIYGNTFRTSQNTQVVCRQPVMSVNVDNSNGQLDMWLKLNPNLNYSTCEIYYYSDDAQYDKSLDFTSNPQTIQYMDENVPDGTYNIELNVVAGSYSYYTSFNDLLVKCTGYIEINDMSAFDLGSNKMIFRANYQMGKYGADTTTFQVRVYDENNNLLDNFTPTVTGDAFTGTLTKAAGIALPENCEYIGYLVEVTNKGGYTNSTWIDIDLT